jgi:hypothetical protein
MIEDEEDVTSETNVRRFVDPRPVVSPAALLNASIIAIPYTAPYPVSVTHSSGVSLPQENNNNSSNHHGSITDRSRAPRI